ncbi:MAG: hypothetical protein ACI9SJ_000787 [Flavobacteriaceae bacterium]|jgi:hypothetical protein|uniref:MbnP family protein n=1 Tax=Candidatus Marifrigoribacter sp. Uisw_064 TaxID=3230970 RepID=UPI003ADAC7A7
MKKIAFLLAITFAFISCNSDDDVTTTPEDTTVDFTFSQNWAGDAIENSDYETTSYTNANGESLKLSKLVYLISDITFTAADGTVYDAGDYNLIDARNGTNVNFTPGIEIPEGDYIVSFTFGFDDEDNDLDGGYLDLNSSDGSWAVPGPLGGGYHYMRMEGAYNNNIGINVNYQYHTVRANRHSSFPPGPDTLEELRDTSFVVNLGAITIGSNTNIEVKMNVDEWFKNPNQWDLNTWYTILMPDFEAQKDMSENGTAGAFSLGTVTQ